MAQPFTLLQLALVLGRPVWWSRAVIGGCDCSVRFMLPPGVVHTSSSTLSHRTVVPVSQSTRRRKTRSAFAWHARTPTGSERLASGQHATLCSFHLCPSSLLPFFVRGKCTHESLLWGRSRKSLRHSRIGTPLPAQESSSPLFSHHLAFTSSTPTSIYSHHP
jgi:hypothetical protein